MTDGEHARIHEAVPEGRSRSGRIRGPDIHGLGYRAALGHVAQEYVTGVVIGDGVGHRGTKHHLSLLGAGESVNDERSAAFADTHQNLGANTGQGHVAEVGVIRQAHHGNGIHVAEQGDGRFPQAGGEQGGNTLGNLVGLAVGSVRGHHRKRGARIQVILGLGIVLLAVDAGDGGVRGDLAGHMDGRKVFQVRDENLAVGFINDAGCLHFLYHQGKQGAGSGLYAFARNLDFPGFSRGIREGERVYLREIQHAQLGGNGEIGLQFGLHAQFHHINEGFVIGRFRIIVRDGDFQQRGFGVRNGETGQFLPGIGSVHQNGRKAGESLTVGAGWYVFRLVTGRKAHHDGYHYREILFHITSTRHIDLPKHLNGVRSPAWGGYTGAPGKSGPCRRWSRKCTGSGRLPSLS